MSQGPNGVSQVRIGALSAHVVHDAGAARLERQWSVIAARTAARTPRRRWVAVAAAVVLAFALGVVLRGVAVPPAAVSWEGTTLESAEGAGTVTLPGGAQLALAPATRIEIASWRDDVVGIALHHGEVMLDVPHLAGRSWTVSAGVFDVRVVGTKFAVRREPRAGGDRVSVEVVRGRVQVVDRTAGGPARELSAGESWRADGGVALAPAEGASSGTVDSTPPPRASSPDAPASAAPVRSGTAADSAAAPSASAPSGPVSTSPPTWEQHAKAKRYRDAYDALGTDGFGRTVDGAGPEKLLRLAEVARASGHPRDAERAYDVLRKRHRGDSRAGLAAFELGRLRLDALGNPSGASEALADAIALAPGAPFREDAEARRVQALHASGATAACVAARDAYLQKYPSGAHAAVVKARCASR